MDDIGPLFDDAVALFRKQLMAAVERERTARTAEAFTAAEREVTRLSQAFSSELTQRVLQQICDDPERQKAALKRVQAKAKPQGIDVRGMGRQKTLVRTLGGAVVPVMAPYAMAKPRGGRRETRGRQGTGVYPILDEIGIVGRSTPALRLLVSRTLCEANSVTSGRELLAATGLKIDHKAALRLTYLVSDDALTARANAMEATEEGVPGGPFAGKRVVAAVDGGRLQVRKRVPGRPRKGGRKRFETEWREPKVLTIYVLNDDGSRDRSIPSVIDATLGDADAVFRLMRYHLLRLGAHEAAQLTLIGDGAKWIWNRAEGLRIGLGLSADRFHEIVDYFHVVERLGELSKTQSRWGEEVRQTWLREQKRRLKAGEVEDIEAVVKVIGTRRDAEMETEAEYWARNRERMRYATFKALGLPRGSGAVESSVRRVVNLRMKGASIAWTEEHAEGMLHLRAHAKSGRWGELEAQFLQQTGWTPTFRRVQHAA